MARRLINMVFGCLTVVLSVVGIWMFLQPAFHQPANEYRTWAIVVVVFALQLCIRPNKHF